MLARPVAVVLGVYFVVATVLAVMKGCEKYNDVFGKPAATNSVGSVIDHGRIQ